MLYCSQWRIFGPTRGRGTGGWKVLNGIIFIFLFDCFAGFCVPDVTWCTKSLWVWNWGTTCAGDIRSTGTWYCSLQQTFWSSWYITAYIGMGTYCTNLSRYFMWVGLFLLSYVCKSKSLIGCDIISVAISEILVAVNVKVVVFWAMMLWGLIE